MYKKFLLGMIALAVASLACMETTAAVGIAPVDVEIASATARNDITVTAGIASPTARNDTAQICGDWNIREGASDAGPSKGWKRNGDAVTVIETAKNGWVRIGEGEWVNGGAICVK